MTAIAISDGKTKNIRRDIGKHNSKYKETMDGATERSSEQCSS